MPHRQRILDIALLALSGVFAVGAIAVSHASTSPTPNATANGLAAAFSLVAAIALGWAGWNRTQREGGRRRWFLLLTAGGVLWLVGQAMRYALLRDRLADPRMAAIPWMLGSPLAIIGLIGIAWPSGMDRDERTHLIIDSVMGVGSLAVIYSQVILPRWVASGGSIPGPVDEIGQWALLAGLSILIVFVVSSRRMGALPLIQLLLLLSGLAVLLTSATMRELAPGKQSQVAFSVLGYWAATCLIAAMMQRSPAEIETQRQKAVRAVIAFVFPFVLVVFAGLIIIDLASESRPDSWLLRAAPFLWVVTLAAVGVATVSSMLRLRDHRHFGVSTQLNVSAERGWIGALFRDSSEYVFVIDAHGNIVYTSPRGAAVLGTTPRLQQLIVEPSRQDFDALLAGITAQALPPGPHEIVMHASDGSHRWVDTHLRPIRDVSFEGFVVSGNDVTDARQLAARLESTGRRDRMTGLLTADSLRSELDGVLAAGLADGVGLAIAVLDLTDFGVWNDSRGRDIGDIILCAVAAELEALPGSMRTVARVGGDSFAILVEDVRPALAMRSCLDGLSQRLGGLILPDDSEIEIRFRAGYTVAQSHTGADTRDLLAQADLALRRARLSRRATAVEFRPGMNADLVQRLAAEGLVREALTSDGLLAYYQPIVSLTDGQVEAVEALARIRTADGLIVGPQSFLEAAEHSGLITPLDRSIRAQAAHDWPIIAAATRPGVRINVNVTESELTSELARELHQAQTTGHFTIELTEASVLSNLEAAQLALQSIREAGGIVAIDDFGTGYSSMSQIASLPCDVIKIDRSFTASMLEDNKAMSLVRAMIQLGHDLGLGIVAEGVENADQAAALRALGCERAQGFYFSPPLPLGHLLHWLKERATAVPAVPAPGR